VNLGGEELKVLAGEASACEVVKLLELGEEVRQVVGREVVGAVVDQDDAAGGVVVDVEDLGPNSIPAQVEGRFDGAMASQYRAIGAHHDGAVLAIRAQRRLDRLKVVSAGVPRPGLQGIEGQIGDFWCDHDWSSIPVFCLVDPLVLRAVGGLVAELELVAEPQIKSGTGSETSTPWGVRVSGG